MDCYKPQDQNLIIILNLNQSMKSICLIYLIMIKMLILLVLIVKGHTCTCDDAFYKLQSQFKDLNIKIITSDNVWKLLKEVSDEKLREKIINFSYSSKPCTSKTADGNFLEPVKNSNYFTPYSLTEVNKRVAVSSAPGETTSLDDLKTEV